MNRGLRDALDDLKVEEGDQEPGHEHSSLRTLERQGHAPFPRAPAGTWSANAPEHHSKLLMSRTVRQYVPVALSH